MGARARPLGQRPALTPETASYAAICGALAAGGIGVPGTRVVCGDRALTLSAARP